MFSSSIGINLKCDSKSKDKNLEEIEIILLKKAFNKIKIVDSAVYLPKKSDSLKEKLEQASKHVFDFLEKNNLSSLSSIDIFIGIENNLVIFKEIQLPLAVKENLYSALSYEMEKHTPLPIKDISFDFQILSEDKIKNKINILLGIIKKSSLLPYIDFANSLQACSIQTNKIALINAHYKDSHINSNINSLLNQDIINQEDNKVLFGLALQGLEKVAIQINFLPQELRKKPSKFKYYALYFLFILSILISIAWFGSFIIKQKIALNNIDLELKRLSKDIESIDKTRASFKPLENKINFLIQAQNSYLLIDVLKELSDIIPQNYWIWELSFSKTGIQIEGQTDFASELITLLENSPLFKDAVFLSTITKEKDGKEKFKIGFKLEIQN